MQIDYKKYVNDTYINRILNENKEKKILCFGAGSALSIMPRILPEGYKIEYFVDNNKNIWNTVYKNIRIKSPEELLMEEKNKFIILLVSQHALSISKQLDDWGFIKDKDYFDLYTSLERCFRIQKIIWNAEKMIQFIERIPENTFDKIMYKMDKRIGVIACCSYMGMPMFYDIATFLLMKLNGYNATLIMDNIYNCENFIMYDGASDDIKYIVMQVIEVLIKRFPMLDIRYIDQNQEELLGEDIYEISRNVKINSIWQKSRLNEKTNSTSIEEYEREFFEVFYQNLKCIKFFFKHNKFDSINVSTGLHYHRWMYLWVGKQKGFRASNYDGPGQIKTSYATNEPNGHSYDVAKVINEKWFTEEEEYKIIQLAKESFLIRKKSTLENGGYNFQKVERSKELDRDYEVFIPLNVMWDAAALGLEDVFTSTEEWLVETLDYLLKNSNVNIMIREHPAQHSLYKDYNNPSYESLLQDNFGKNPRIYYVRSEEEINSYQMISKAKVVLPISSTIGVEAVLLNKKVIVHTNCYYSRLSFVDKAKSKNEYYQMIIDAIAQSESNITKENIDKAYLSYILLLNNQIETSFRESCPDWYDCNLIDLSNENGVQKILKVIAEGIPACYQNVLEIINE
ncbi:capsular polysaccharide export protein, LipB/KpsS family [Anaeromicropila herbilytica]|uniref:Capsule polysaccharide biosynthesis protein n=1 Tax=Anaeromicropila herbilytica TaxID=2785025 RepID=A0A7R7EPB8_9FIRM|nr:hypothetical protein [Anaeromicropila herbilytica]BCN32518.1 hypothetical protein bsdtb5_38130 [Anaeromicropila herbilytica]